MTSTTMNRCLRVASLTGVLALGLAMAGCGPTRGYGYTATYSPGMVAVDNGVWAVTGYDDPIFYGGDYYWRYNRGYWYRSPYLGGWNRVGLSVVPPRIRYIDRPGRYRRYVAPRSAHVRRVPRAHYRSRAYRPYRSGRDYRYRRGDTRVRRAPAARYRRGPVGRHRSAVQRGGARRVRPR